MEKYLLLASLFATIVSGYLVVTKEEPSLPPIPSPIPRIARVEQDVVEIRDQLDKLWAYQKDRTVNFKLAEPLKVILIQPPLVKPRVRK